MHTFQVNMMPGLSITVMSFLWCKRLEEAKKSKGGMGDVKPDVNLLRVPGDPRGITSIYNLA